ncbi:amidohydrolase [Actinotalea fermentans]|uniref:Peptidase n=1 Tax=Actinotalea fermentans TaxID=43671 RepID=A0A511Z1W3_9CELL|nr:amidohydrolase [Actinotalea fermentans]KGM16455.1 amidohydrolase [Actinotalea fermentans ATCC 43279 = JCM 9966 = DSM 3133]GEN81445.1 peptidase [Actinotalea fermentans]
MPALDQVLSHLGTTRTWQEELYRHLHAHPELGLREEKTRTLIAERLAELGYEVRTAGGGVVGVLANGPGPVVLSRADIDGLPVKEETGLPYASTDTTVDESGQTVGLMHACGHDAHITCLLGAAALLAAQRDAWSGTFLALFQPAEETAAGARSMVDDGLTDLIPRPDVAFAQHVLGHEAGVLATQTGPVLSAGDSIRITVFGKGSHGSMPHLGVDPVVLASAIVLRLQSIVSREVAPGEFAVVTVGALNAGSKSNVIPDRATLLVNLRTYDTRTRERVVAAVERIVRGECAAAGSPHQPTFEYYDQFPLTDNDAEVTSTVTEAFRAHFGTERVIPLGRVPASEDFSRIPDAFGTPYTYWGLGGFAPGTGVPNHSPFFAPLIQPTLDAGTQAVVVAAMAYFGKDLS